MTEIYCKCGSTRLEEIMCADCGEYYGVAGFNNWKLFDISEIERGKEYVFYFQKADFYKWRFGRIVDDFVAGDLEFDFSDYQEYYSDMKKYGSNLPTHYFEITNPQESE